MKSLHGIWLGAAALSIASCSDATGPEGMARIEVFLTDAPAEYLEEAWVCISQVYLQGGEDEDAGRTVLWEADPEPADSGDGCYDLLTLQGIKAPITDGAVEVPAGTYHQLRFIVESSWVKLAGEDSDMELTVPSGAQTGIKVLLSTPIFAEAQALTEITVDAPVEDNFRVQGNPESPAGIQGVLFTPVLKQIEIPE